MDTRGTEATPTDLLRFYRGTVNGFVQAFATGKTRKAKRLLERACDMLHFIYGGKVGRGEVQRMLVLQTRCGCKLHGLSAKFAESMVAEMLLLPC